MRTIRKLTETGVPISGEFRPENLSEAWRGLEEWEIAQYPWGGEYQPKVFARIGVRDGGLCVLMYALEPEIQAKETRCGGAVCVDSCLEFFVQPFEDDARYANIEANPLGTMHLGIGSGRAGRELIAPLPSGISPVTSVHKGAWWAVYYELPASFFVEYFGKPLAGAIRANLYTCDESIHPHFGTLFPVTAPRPDFHRPEYFGQIAIEEG